MSSHSVCFYRDDTVLIDRVVNFAKSGLEHQETVIIVATEQHLGELKTRLMGAVAGHSDRKAGHCVTLDASATLALFMRDGWPEEALYFQVIGQIIQSTGGTSTARIYGEMVAVLFTEGNPLAAIHLERLWNKLAKQRSFSLLCGYPSHAFQEPVMDFAFQDICACHSKIEGDELSISHIRRLPGHPKTTVR